MEEFFAGWPREVWDVLEEGVGALEGVSNRLVRDLEAEGMLLILDLLLRTPGRIRKIATLDDKSWGRLLAALRKKGFRRRRSHKLDPDKPLYEIFEGCEPPKVDLPDLLNETIAVDQNLGLLAYLTALERGVWQLEDVQTHFPPDSRDHEMLEWSIYYASTRLLEPPEEE